MAGARGDQVDEIVALAAVGRPVGVLGEPGIGVSTALDHAAEAMPGAVRRTGALRSLRGVSHLALRRAFDVDPAQVDLAALARQALGEGTLVIDDLQWADPDTLARLEELAGAVKVLVGIRTGDDGTAAARAAVAAAGGTIIRLAPLDPTETTSLARSIRPDLDEPNLDRAAEAAAGNPLVLQQLLRHGEVASSLADALAADAASLPTTALVALAALSECPDGLPSAALEPHLGRLADDGFVSHEGSVARARHQLVPVSVLERLDADGQAAARRLAASHLTDAGHRAHLLATAGDTEAALPLALEAASGAAAGARHGHLAIAARCATGPQQAALFADALDAAMLAWDRPAARCLAEEALAGPCSQDPMVRVAAAEAQARDAAPNTALSTLATIADPRPEVRARVHATRAFALAWPRWDGEGASAEAAAARSVIDDPRAALGAALAGLVLGSAEHDPRHLPEELQPLACLWAGSAAAAAGAVPGFGPSTDREVLRALVAFHETGACDSAAVRLRQVRDVAERPVDRELLTAHLAIALADSGRTAVAAELALEGLADDPSDVGRAHLLWALIEAEVAGGRLVRAAHAAEQAAAGADSPARCLAELIASWAVAIAPNGDGPCATRARAAPVDGPALPSCRSTPRSRSRRPMAPRPRTCSRRRPTAGRRGTAAASSAVGGQPPTPAALTTRTEPCRRSRPSSPRPPSSASGPSSPGSAALFARPACAPDRPGDAGEDHCPHVRWRCSSS